ncbi:hypothetical protein JCM16303_000313 [Sporobolomyces ruberrimus]
MARLTRLYTLCVLFLLAHQPPSTAAQFERVSRRSDTQLDKRQRFGDLFGGGRDTATPQTTPATTATSAISPATSDAVIDTAHSSPSTSLTTSARPFPIPIFGGQSSSTATATLDPSASQAPTSVTSASTEPSATSAPVSESSTAEKSSASQVIVTITSIVTNADGSHSTMVQQSSSAVPAKENDGSGPSGKTWGIIGGVVGGVVLLIGAILILWRCTQRRFDNLDQDVDEIKWPELQPDGQTVSAGLSTLNPAATRRTGRAGIEMEKDEGSEWGDDSPRLGVRPEANESQYFDPSYAVPYQGEHGTNSQRGSYYEESYQNQRTTPYPPPPTIGYHPPSTSPYGHYADAEVSNASFRNSHAYGSNEDVPLVPENHEGGGGGGISASGGIVPTWRVSSPTSQHRM